MNSNRFSSAITALVNAFYNETLDKGSCTKCAVGNIVHHSLNKINPELTGFAGEWTKVFMTPIGFTEQITTPDRYYGTSKAVIDSTNYSWQELALVEKAFESNTKQGDLSIDNMYNGLMAVVDVLCEIEGIESTNTKELFSKHSKCTI